MTYTYILVIFELISVFVTHIFRFLYKVLGVSLRL